ncbi:MAG: hypothetical protein HFJ80_05930 [Clostridiales bacterium]|nr:hypothetical protein [Clostridiales bacterium]
MKRGIRNLLLLPFLLLLLGSPVRAEPGKGEEQALFTEQVEASGADELPQHLPEETRQLLDKLGITGLEEGTQSESIAALQPDRLLDALLDIVGEQSGGPLRSAGVLLGIILIGALMDGMRQTLREPAASGIFESVCALAACAAVLMPVSAVIRTVCSAAESVSVFMTSYVPVYAGVLLTSGQAAAAASYHTVVLFAAEMMTLLVTQVVLPLMTVSLALGLVGSVSSGMRLETVGGMMSRAAVWLLGITTTLFVGLLSLQGLMGSAADSLSGRAIRFSLSSMVPVVGNALSEAFTTVRGCLGMLKTTLGGYGMLATALIVLPPLVQCALWCLCLSVCGAAAELFELKSLTALFRSALSVLKTLIGVLSACALFMIIATAVVTLTGHTTV